MHTTNRSLEGLRGTAALLVVLFHMKILSAYSGVVQNGYLCVDLFFVLSGYVICSAYASRVTNSREVFRFVVRRIGRLWPLHVLSSVLFYGLLSLHAVTSHQPVLVPTLAEFVSLLTMTNGFNLFDHNIGNSVSWSAGDELYVYVVFAVTCIALRVRAFVLFAAFAIIGALIAFRINADYCFTHGACYDMTYSFGWARCLAGFFLGALVARHGNALHLVTSQKCQVIAAVGALVLLQIAAVVPPLAFGAPVVFGLLVASLARDSGPVAGLLRKRPLQYLGEVSYALYLSHAVFLVYFINMVDVPGHQLAWRAGCCAGFLFASFALAHFLHRYIEIPLREQIYAFAEKMPAIRGRNETGLAANE
ncbi:acyltransferase family protein [Paraburkholderia sp. A1RI-2L]|uniref:acyltransferase family protein n=1 Tax=unclassified Paraburkholderia TaxID=2615204 RepID=UPI003B7AAB48